MQNTLLHLILIFNLGCINATEGEKQIKTSMMRLMLCIDCIFSALFEGHSVRLLGQKKDNGKRLGGARLDLPKIRKNPLIEIISINTG